MVDRNALDSPALGLELASALTRLYPGNSTSGTPWGMVGSRQVLQALKCSEDPREIQRRYQPGLQAFLRLAALQDSRAPRPYLERPQRAVTFGTQLGPGEIIRRGFFMRDFLPVKRILPGSSYRKILEAADSGGIPGKTVREKLQPETKPRRSRQ